MKLGFLQSEHRNSSPAAARYHIIPVPLEATVSYGGGTAQGPRAIIEASQQLERIVEGMDEPGLYGIHTAEPTDCSYADSPIEVFLRTAEFMERSVASGSVPILLGGEHSITNSAVELIKTAFPGGEAGIIQFDAHMDLRSSYEGSRFSHASVMRRAVEAGIPLYQVGIRSYCAEELKARETYHVHHCDASHLHRLLARGEGFASISLPASFPKQVYITFDVDCFDASLMPATGTPEPGGLMWQHAAELLTRLTSGRKIIGADVVELAPIAGLHHCSFTAAKLTHLLMGLAAFRTG